MPLQDEYQVTLDSFCGPLDLLLYLIRRAEVDIHDIPIAAVTDQYLSFLKQVDDVDIEAAGEFLVMAATLMEIKSRSLMPPLPEGEADGDGADGADAAGPGEPVDPRFELVQQLLEYQRYRLAAETLEDRRIAFARQFPVQPFPVEAAPAAEAASEPAGEQAVDGAEAGEADEAEAGTPEPPPPPDLDLEDAHLFDLYETYERIIAAIDFSRLGDHRIEIDDTPAALYQEDLLDRLTRAEGGRLTLQEVFQGQRRVQRIGLFLATLELVRLRRIAVRQEDLLADIAVELVAQE